MQKKLLFLTPVILMQINLSAITGYPYIVVVSGTQFICHYIHSFIGYQGLALYIFAVKVVSISYLEKKETDDNASMYNFDTSVH